MGSFVSMGSATFGIGLCYNTHTVLLRLLEEDPNETLFKILLASFIFVPSHFFLYIKKKRKTSIILLSVSYVQIAANQFHETWP